MALGLIDHFLGELGRKDAAARLFPPSNLTLLAKHRWPGNVRELRNVVESTLVMGEAPRFDAEAPGEDAPAEGSFDSYMGRPFSQARSDLVEAFERYYLSDLIERADGNVSEAARIAGMNRSYLSQLLTKRGLRRRRK